MRDDAPIGVLLMAYGTPETRILLEVNVSGEVGIGAGTAAWLDVSARGGKIHNALASADAI